MPDEESIQQRHVLKAKASDVRTISSLLRPIALTKICQVNISEAGLQVITEINGILQANAYIGSGLFDEYTYNPPLEDFDDDDDDEETSTNVPITVFDVSLETWLHCLNIYNTAAGVITSTSLKNDRSGIGRDMEMRRMPFVRGRTMMQMSYAGRGHPLILELKDGKVTTRCELATYFAGEVLVSEMPFLSERAVGQVIITSKRLTEALLSIDHSCRNVTFEFIQDWQDLEETLPQTPTRKDRSSYHQSSTLPTMIDQDDGQEIIDTRRMYENEVGKELMRITAQGDNGSDDLTFPNKNRVFESFFLRFPCKFTYSYSNIQHCLRALQTSLKCSIRIDDQGMMSVQCLFPDRPIFEREIQDVDEQAGPERKGFVELRMLSVAEEESM